MFAYKLSKHIVSLMRLCKSGPPCESLSVNLFFAPWFEKLLALSLVCGQSQDTELAGYLGFSSLTPQSTLSLESW